jgi:hypothetical protein
MFRFGFRLHVRGGALLKRRCIFSIMQGQFFVDGLHSMGLFPQVVAAYGELGKHTLAYI